MSTTSARHSSADDLKFPSTAAVATKNPIWTWMPPRASSFLFFAGATLAACSPSEPRRGPPPVASASATAASAVSASATPSAPDVSSALVKRFLPAPPKPDAKRNLSPRGTPFLSLDEIRRRHYEDDDPSLPSPGVRWLGMTALGASLSRP